MDAHCEMILEQYRENLPVYVQLQSLVVKTLKDFVSNLGVIVNSVEARVKTEKSLIGKLELKGYKYLSINDITDIVGARVVTFYSSEIDKFAAKLEKVFEIDWDRSIDKRKMHKVDQFGYMSLHYICNIPKTLYYDEKMPQLNEIKFEVQLRTTLQHVWATIYHDTGYKNDVEIPSVYLRDLNRLAGLLELADKEFNSIKCGIDEYRKRIIQIVASGDLAGVDLNADSFNAFVDKGAFEPINKRIAEINNMDITQVPLNRFIKVLKLFDFNTLEDVNDLIIDYSESAYQFMVRVYNGMDVDIIASNVGIIALIMCYALDKGYGFKALVQINEFVYGPRKSNERLAKKFYEIGAQMGLVK